MFFVVVDEIASGDQDRYVINIELNIHRQLFFESWLQKNTLSAPAEFCRRDKNKPFLKRLIIGDKEKITRR